MTNQELVFNLAGQTLFYDPPEGQATGTPTVSVFASDVDDDDTAESATSGSCSVGSVDTTFSASAGDTQVTVTSGTGITRGRRYLVTDTDGDREWVEVLSVSGTTVNLRQPLVNNYAAGSTFQGCRISVTVDSTWIADDGNISDAFWSDVPGAAGYRCRWSYTVDGTATIGVSFFDVVRYQAKNLVTPLDVDRRFPGWIDRLGSDYREDQGQALIDEAFQSIKMDALGDAQIVRQIRNTEVIRELTIYRANVIAQEASLFNGGSNVELVQAARDIYEQRYKQLIREPKIPVDRDGSGASSQAERLPAFRR